MTDLLTRFEQFLDDEEADTMYITGVAGTGKTTSLAELVEYCLDEDIDCIVSAYTHKACEVLKKKMPKEATIATLHSFLAKRPTINVNAHEVKHVDGNAQMKLPEETKVLFIDEFSMVGDRDYVSINDLQYTEDGDIKTKIVYIGDPNQLPPVKDIPVIIPKGDYWVKLDKIYRQAGDNQLIDNLLAINNYINGEEAQELLQHDNLIRGVNIIKEYKKCLTDKIILAYTNAKVEELNAEIQGYYEPKPGDTVFTPTIRLRATLLAVDKNCTGCISITGKFLELGSKYKTLETLHEIEEVKYYTIANDKGQEQTIAAVFGHNQFLLVQQRLADNAVKLNKQIANEFDMDAKDWAKDNWSHPLAKARGKAWGKYLAFKENVHCLDFNHALTVHKSQGSTYETVFIDTKDLGKCADKDYTMYLKLLYVAISRASSKVYTN